MRKLNACTTIILLICVLSACGSQKTKNTGQISSDAERWFKRGELSWQLWEKNDQLKDLADAYRYYKNAYTLEPQKANHQHAHYLSSVYHGFYTESVSEEELLAIYQHLPPAVLSEVPPPARMEFAIQNFKQATPQELIPLAKRAIKQKPTDAMSWKQLGEQYTRLGQYALAAHSTFRALELDSTVAEYHWHFANNLARLAKNQSCTSGENSRELNLAATHSAKAAFLKSDNPYWFTDSANFYLALGLTPLSQYLVQHSRELEINAGNIAAHIKTSLLLDTPFQTDAFVKEAENTLHTKESFKTLAMASAANGIWNFAEEFMSMAKEQGELDIQDLAVYYWLGRLAGKTNSAEDQLKLKKTANKEEQEIIRLVLNADATGFNQRAVFAKQNSCTKLKSDFYSALVSWRAGQTDAMVTALNRAANSAFNNAKEKVWAQALLNGFLIEN